MKAQSLKLDAIRLSGENMRLEATDIEELAASIREHGILQPLVVDMDFVLVCGHRRLAAAREAGLTEVPVVVRDIPGDRRFVAALAENLHRSQLSPLEEAQAVKRLRAQHPDMTQKQLGALLGKDQTWISNRIMLLRLPEHVQKAVHERMVGLQSALNARRTPRGERVRAPETRDQDSRRQIHNAKKLLRWVEGGHIPKIPELLRVLEALRQALNAFAGSTGGAAIPIERRCAHDGCGALLSHYTKGDYCGAHEHLHVRFA